MSQDDDREKWKFLRAAPIRDARNPLIQSIARSLWAATLASTEDVSLHQRRFVQLAHTVARDWITQVIDTARVGEEDIAGFTRAPTFDDAVDALRRGVDDCDAKARLFVALCLVVGVQARMEPVWKGDRLEHVWSQAFIDGAWMPVELTLARARLGEVGGDVPKEGNGKWKET
jgi:transglutaminase-like putative cysteine protease